MGGGGQWRHGGGLEMAETRRGGKGSGEPAPLTEGLLAEVAEEGHRGEGAGYGPGEGGEHMITTWGTGWRCRVYRGAGVQVQGAGAGCRCRGCRCRRQVALGGVGT